MSFPEFAIRRPVAAWMLMAALVFFGLLSLFSLGISRFPDVTYPVITVVTQWPGAAPEVMESEIVDPLENVLVSVQGIKDIESTMLPGIANIKLEFYIDKNIDAALQEVNSKVRSVRLPTDVNPPQIFKINQDDSPILWLAVTWDRPLKDLVRYVDKYIRDRFMLVHGIGDIQLGGWADRNLRIWLDRNKLNQLQLSPTDIRDMLQAENMELGAGYLESKTNEINVRIMGEARSEYEMQSLALNHRAAGASGIPITGIGGSQGGGMGVTGAGSNQFLTNPAMTSAASNLLSNTRGASSVYIPLSTVASVEDGIMDLTRLSRSDGQPAIGLGIQKLRGFNEIAVAKEVKDLVKELKKDLPEGMAIGPRFDSSVYTQEAVHETEFTLLLTIFFTASVCLLFLGSFRTTLNVLFSIPISILGSFIFFKFLGYTLNFFTLLALSLAVGIVVDDSIMVLENITRHKNLGKDPQTAALDGANEVSFAALAATLSIVAVFCPILFVGGVVGKFLSQFGVALSVAVLISLLEALTLAPMRVAEFLNVGKEEKKNYFEVWLDKVFWEFARIYRNLLKLALQKRWLVVSVSFLIFFLSLRLFPALHKELSPSEDMGIALIRIETPVGSSLEHTGERVRFLEEYLKQQPYVAHVFSSIGGYSGGQVNFGALFITLTPRKERKLRLQEILKIWRKEFKKAAYQDLHIKIIDISQSAFSSKRGTNIELSLLGSEYSVLKEVSQKILNELDKSGMYTDLDTDYREGMPEVQIIPDRDKCALANISMQQLVDSVRYSIGGARQGMYTNEEDIRRYDIRIRFIPEQWREPKDIEDIPLWTNYGGEPIHLKDVASLRVVPKLMNMTRENRRRVITLFANVKPEYSQAKALDYAMEICRKLLPPTYSVQPAGASQTAKETFGAFPYALGFGLILAYMVLGIQFNSFLFPLIILCAIPFSITGAIFSLYISKLSLNLYSGIGLILLMGLAMKNSILLVEFINKKRFEDGLDTSAAILEAAFIRLRPILMTSLATISSAIPAALGLGPGAEVRVPLVIVVIGGIVVSTSFSLFVVPCIYSLAAKIGGKPPVDLEEWPEVQKVASL
ncbi:multidrug transporter [Methylacidiphilum kamchatkense Kam1]|uniref:Multidrug transporter n=2 Tax=Methylacidiphilum kamchatkense Kam1 TaxID=1202785 RepID=A0ABR5A041_9BACT|nr:efflux RND transporter permease subunit [Methylacidiphilum kamchatkense]KIE59391.1 multidrug transporter [Methylacidiphilum kamchatkense Kam1]